MSISTGRKLWVGGIAAVLGIAAIATIGAATSQEGNWDHFVTCFGDMITDPQTHAANCLPGGGPGINSLSLPVTATVPGVPSSPSTSTNPPPSTTGD